MKIFEHLFERNLPMKKVQFFFNFHQFERKISEQVDNLNHSENTGPKFTRIKLNLIFRLMSVKRAKEIEGQ